VPSPLRVLAPVAGTVRDLADVPDAVFGQGIVGPGLAIDPLDGEVCAPLTGVVVAARSHALVVRGDGRDVLVHLGVDTVNLDGSGFQLLVRIGEPVTAGAAVLRWDPAAVARAGLSPLCPVVALQGKPGAVRLLVRPGDVVERGAPVLDWT